MEFIEISEDNSVFPGEYIYHEPSKTIVLAGAFNRKENYIRVLKHGRYLEDIVSNFKKIELSKQEKKERFIAKGCKSCKGQTK
tara:strand:- start:3984 stop:4232 length:249 start_codon:yes stop_codon:yes gene_type:complete